jgi:hypothetical protein
MLVDSNSPFFIAWQKHEKKEEQKKESHKTQPTSIGTQSVQARVFTGIKYCE